MRLISIQSMTVSIKKILTGSFALGAGCFVMAAAEEKPKFTTEQLDFFEKKIRPVLSKSCYSCHSAEASKLRAELFVDTREGLLRGGTSGAAIVPGKPDKSLLFKSIAGLEKDLQMPPKGEPLSEDQIEDFRRWITMGAPDPREAKAGTVAAAGMKVDMAKAREHWAYKPVANPAPPKVSDSKHWAQTPVDNFVLAMLKEKGLEPSPKTDKRTLLRRVSYDLIGLPPTAEEVDAFLADKSADALTKVVDRLLASPHYGERWGRHWLDIARYADTTGDRQNGGRRNPLFPYAHTYRDYVIEAFNRDLPYDQFIVQQIAADRLPEAEKDKKILAAMGFLTVGKRFMGNENDVIDDRIDVVTKGLMGITASCARCHDHKFDPVPTKDYYSLHGVFSSSQEPKDGPLLVNPEANPSYKDFIAAIADIDKDVEKFHDSEATRFVAGMLRKSSGYILAVHDAAKDKERQNSFRLVARKRGLEAELAEFWNDTLKSLAKKSDPVFGPLFKLAALSENDFAAKSSEVLADLAKADPEKINPTIAKALVAQKPKSFKEVAEVYEQVFGKLADALKVEEYTPLRQARNRRIETDKLGNKLADASLESLRKYFFSDNSPVAPEVRSMERYNGVQFRNAENTIRSKQAVLQMTHPGSPARAMVMEDLPKARDSRVMLRGEPRNFGPVAPRQFLEILSGENRTPFKDGSGRLELAKNIASRDNPLTARVFVNRVWQWHFGQAIVRTPSDFGMRAETPTHPALLDYLASYFMDNGWSVKKLHKLIILSSVYQQDSKSTKKGMEVDPTNQWLWRFNIQRLDFEAIRDTLLTLGGQLDDTMGGPAVNIAHSPRPNNNANRYMADLSSMPSNPNRRTVYAMIDRATVPDMFNTFDFANPDMTTGERIMTTVPQQALFMMNSPFVAEQARKLVASQNFHAANQNEDKVKFLYRTILQRQPSAQEIKMSLSYLESQTGGDGALLLPESPAAEAPRNAKGKQASRPAPRNEATSTKPLGAWERLSQVVLLSNEFIYLN
jgi:hypothetical protein